jgi:hypothetical protein
MVTKTFVGSSEQEATNAREKWLSDNPKIVVKHEFVATVRKPAGRYAPIGQGIIERMAITVEYDEQVSTLGSDV